MHNLKKILAALLALVMIFGLMACGKDNDETPAAPDADELELTDTPIESLGSLDLVGNSRLKLHYNADSNVVAILDENGAPAYDELLDSACDEAVVQILRGAENGFASSFLLIRQTSDTLVPYDDFLPDIVSKAQKEVGDLPVILSSAADQDGNGYFSAETALAIITAYLGNPTNATYDIAAECVDGYYTVNVVLSNTSETYTVGALYGSVELQTETEDDFIESPDEVIEPEETVAENTEEQDVIDDSQQSDDVPDEEIVEDIPEEVIG